MDFDRIKRMADGDNTNTTETTSNKILRHKARRRVPFTHSRSDLEDWAIKRLCGRETGKEGNSRNGGGFGKWRRTLLFSLALRLSGRFPMHHASNLCNTFFCTLPFFVLCFEFEQMLGRILRWVNVFREAREFHSTQRGMIICHVLEQARRRYFKGARKRKPS